MPQVLAKSRRCLVVLLLILPLITARALPASESRTLDWRSWSAVVASWFGASFEAPNPAETLPTGPEDGTPLDQGGASMDPAGGGTGGTGGTGSTGGGTRTGG